MLFSEYLLILLKAKDTSIVISNCKNRKDVYYAILTYSCPLSSVKNYKLHGRFKLILLCCVYLTVNFKPYQILYVVLFNLFMSNAWAGVGEPLVPTQIADSITIDGELVESHWKSAVVIEEFITYKPDFNKEMPLSTKVLLTYSSEYIYIAFICDDDPNLVKTSLSPRDQIQQDDWIRISLDSYNDNQTMNRFIVNPNGIQMDTRMSGFRDDPGIDFVWYSAGKVTGSGYQVEIQIPFKSLRYSMKNNTVKMGMVFERFVSRMSINGTFPKIDPAIGDNFLIQTKEIVFNDVKKNTLIEFLPSVTYGQGKANREGVMVKTGGNIDVGATAKIGITSDLTFDVTINPDFSQVESDAGQIDNNQRIPVYFPERRPFFQEGSENFSFAGSGWSEGPTRIVNTRRIVNPQLAAKLAGKIGKYSRIAAIYAKDELYTDETLTDPYADFAVLRYRRSFNNDGYVGAFSTSRWANKAYSHLFGTDAKVRINNGSVIDAHFFKTFNMDETTSEETRGHSGFIGYQYQSRGLDLRVRYSNFSEDFTSMVANTARVGVTKYTFGITPKFYFDHAFFKSWETWTFFNHMYDQIWGMWEYNYYINTWLSMVKNTSFNIEFIPKTEIFEGQKFNRTNGSARLQGQITKRLNVSAEYGYGYKIRYVENPYLGRGKDVQLELQMQFNDNLNSQITANYSDFKKVSDGTTDFTRLIIRSKNTYQVNKFLFLRAIVQFDSSYPEIMADYLASFTLIPGTVVHVGYGTLHNKMEWDEMSQDYVPALDQYVNFRKGVFFKASYLFRNK